MDPSLQYGPSYSGSFSPISIGIVVVGILLSSWLFGAVYTLITRGNNPLTISKRQSKESEKEN